MWAASHEAYVKIAVARFGFFANQLHDLIGNQLSSVTTGATGAQVSFADLNLSEETLAALDAAKFQTPTPVQAATIPHMMSGKDLIAQAATGTGKTAAFSLPIIEKLRDSSMSRIPSALILVPTRELAIQVARAFDLLARGSNISCVAVYGGQPLGVQATALKKGAQVVVATPGRAVDLLDRGVLKFDKVECVVLDEADEMLDMGFAEELDRLLGDVPDGHQTALFSATMPSRLRKIASSQMQDPTHISVERERDNDGLVSGIHHVVYLVDRQHRLAALGRVLDFEAPRAALVFGRSRDQVDELADEMNKRGYRAEALHGGMSQEQRDKVMNRLRKGLTNLLIATDVAARGLDIDHLTHVVNYDIPMQAETYVHRSGRVGRGGRSGVSITIGGRNDRRKVSMLEKAAGKRFEFAKLPTAAQLSTRQLEQTQQRLRDAVIDGGSDTYEGIMQTLSAEFSMEKLTLAALKLVHESAHSTDMADIPDALDSRQDTRGPRDKRGAKPFGRDGRDGREGRQRSGGFAGGGSGGRRGAPTKGAAKIYIGIGRDAAIRPKDLVGAIANEADVAGHQIGNIDIAPRFSIVEVPKNRADDVIRALRATSIKGRKVTVRPDREK